MTLQRQFCQGNRRLPRHLRPGVARPGGLLVNRELAPGLLQFDGDLKVGLLDLVILAVCPETMRDHLDSDHAIGNAPGFGLAVFMVSTPDLPAFPPRLVNHVEHDLGIFYRLAIAFPLHEEAHLGGRRPFLGTVLLSHARQGGQKERQQGA